jgi:hypothetical protein
MVIPFRFETPERALSTKFDQRLILTWPFGETNAAAMRKLKPVRGLYPEERRHPEEALWKSSSSAAVARGLSAHFSASVWRGSSRSHFKHLNSVRPFSAMTAFIRLLQRAQRVVSMVDLRFRANVSMEQKFPR